MSEKIPPERIKWEDSTIIQQGFPVDIQNEDRFSPRDTFAFNPLAQSLMSPDNAILALVLVKLAQTDPKAVVSLMEKYIDSATEILTEIADSGKAHPITAINASTQFAVVAHRFGIITNAGYLKLVDQTRHILDNLVNLAAAGIAFDGLTTLVGGSKTTKGKKGAQTGLDLLGLVSMLKGLKP